MTRDPRLNPQPGDRVEFKPGFVREVTHRSTIPQTGNEFVRYDINGVNRYCWVWEWVESCRINQARIIDRQNNITML